MWSPDGRTLYYREAARMMAVDIQTDPEFSAGKPRVLFEAPELGMWYDLSPDGRKFVMIQNAEESVQPQIHIVLNWHQELLRLVPAE